MHNRFAQTINDMRGLINDWSAPVLLAVSGGADSICMAELFAATEPRVPFAVAHCNFRLRGEESDGDEQLVRLWAESHGAVFHCVSFDTREYAAGHGISIEMAARDLRYEWFNTLCREHGYCAVAVAHNANDNAETLLLNLVRGTGIKGITGMAAVSELPCRNDIGASGPKLIRPLLSFTRKQIEGYLFAGKIRYRDDSTNASVEYRRNSIRHEVFPVLERLNPSYIRTLNREIGYFAEIADIVDEHCSELIAGILEKGPAYGGEQVRISINRLLSQRHWRYLLYRMLEPYGFNSSVLESLEDLLVSDRTVSGKCFRSQSHVLMTERNELVVRIKSDHDREQMVAVRGAGTYNLNGCRFNVEVVPWTSDMSVKQNDGTVIMDAARIPFPFVCRVWRQGDWFIPLGMKGRKKVSDLFADLKYSRVDKEEAVMIVDTSDSLAAQQHVAGVLGVRIDDRYKVSESTSEIVRITLYR